MEQQIETTTQIKKSELAAMNETGDSKFMWSKDVPAEVEAARKQFNDLRAKGYVGYSVKGKDGDKGEIIHAFDPDAERIIMAPAMQGG